jgi:hypothetical protein
VRFADLAVQRMLNILDESGGAGVGATHGSLHTAYSTTGANEVTGGSPAYARKAATWAAASGRSKATSASMVFDVPASTTVRWVGLWDAVTAGNFLGMTPNGGGTPEAFTVPVIADDTLEAPGHGFSNAQMVVVWAVPGVALPTGLSEGTVYHVRDATTDDLKLAATAGGAAIDITAVGSGMLQRIVEETFGAQGTHTVTSATMSLD